MTDNEPDDQDDRDARITAELAARAQRRHEQDLQDLGVPGDPRRARQAAGDLPQVPPGPERAAFATRAEAEQALRDVVAGGTDPVLLDTGAYEPTLRYLTGDLTKQAWLDRVVADVDQLGDLDADATGRRPSPTKDPRPDSSPDSPAGEESC